MGTLLLNARPGRQHPTSAPKIGKQNAYYLPASMTRRAKRALSNQPALQKNSKQNAYYLLTN
jgi:hypothetical protein